MRQNYNHTDGRESFKESLSELVSVFNVAVHEIAKH